MFVSVLVLSQEIGWEELLRNDLFYVEWDVKPQLNQPGTEADCRQRLAFFYCPSEASGDLCNCAVRVVLVTLDVWVHYK